MYTKQHGEKSIKRAGSNNSQKDSETHTTARATLKSGNTQVRLSAHALSNPAHGANQKTRFQASCHKGNPRLAGAQALGQRAVQKVKQGGCGLWNVQNVALLDVTRSINDDKTHGRKKRRVALR